MFCDVQECITHKPTGENKNVYLFLRQKETLDVFLNNGALNREQYNKSLSDLAAKMGMEEYLNPKEE